jgi:hypothetical protein
MNERSFREELRSAFDQMTRSPHPALSAQIRDELLSGPARSRGPRLAAVLAAALALIVVVGLLATGRMGVRMPSNVPVPASSHAPRQAPSQAPSPLPSGAPSPAVGAAAPGASAAGFTCADVSGGGAGQARVTAVRTAAQSGYDRFVVQFDGPLPQYEVHVQSGSTFVQDASGAPVTLQGSSGLLVVLRNTSSSGSYSGPTDLHPNVQVVREERLVGDFEGVVHWALGLSHPACYRVTTLSNPSRLVIDVQT